MKERLGNSMSENKAIVVTAVKTLEIQDLEMPKIGPNEVLYEVHSCSLCTVEQRVYSGAKNFGFPLLGGHENAGVVIAVGDDVREYKVGDKVIATLGYCGECEYCKTGKGSSCKNSMKAKKRVNFPGPIIGGGLAKYLAVPSWQLCKIPDNANFDHFALTEPLACCVHSIEKARVEFGDVVVVIGAGIMGMLHVRLAKLRGAYVIVSEVDQARRLKATEMGADVTVDPSTEDAVARIKELTNNKGADVVINAIATPKIWPDAIGMLAPYGRLVAYSSQDSKEPVGVDMDKLHSKEYEIIGTVSPTMESNLRATKLIALGMVDMEALIDSRYESADCTKAFDRASSPNTYRCIIHI